MEREGVSTLSIRSYLQALRGFLILKYLCALCIWKFVLKMPWYGRLCNVSRECGESIQSVLKMFLKSSFLCKCKDVLSKLLTTIYFVLEKASFFSSYPLDSAILLLVKM